MSPGGPVASVTLCHRWLDRASAPAPDNAAIALFWTEDPEPGLNPRRGNGSRLGWRRAASPALQAPSSASPCVSALAANARWARSARAHARCVAARPRAYYRAPSIAISVARDRAAPVCLPPQTIARGARNAEERPLAQTPATPTVVVVTCDARVPRVTAAAASVRVPSCDVRDHALPFWSRAFCERARAPHPLRGSRRAGGT